ncbi:MAG: twin-arginine translocase subunit TatC [Actinomycetota bacterium]
MKNPLSRSPKPEAEAEADMTLLGHLSELRTRLMRSVLAIVIGAIVVYIFNEPLFNFLADPYCDLQVAQGKECEFIIRTPTENFSVVLSLSGYGGMLLAMPVILYQLGKFVMPGLYPSERKVLLPFFFASILLLLGGLIGGYLLMPKTLSVLGGFGPDSFTEFFSPRDYIGFFIKMLLAFGIAAELPLVLIFLQLVGVVSTATLRRNRRIAVVAVVILSAIVTPTGDPFTLAVLAVPMYLFYEVALIVGGRMTKRRELMVTG